MLYLIYKITHILSGKIYIGAHKTCNVNDNYMGSGKYLKYAIKKYGIAAFTKEILFIYDNATDMYQKESELVTEEFLSETNTYNLKIGGSGFSEEDQLKGSLLGTKARQKLRETNPEWVDNLGQSISKGLKSFYKKNIHWNKGGIGPMTGKTLTPEQSQKISKAKKGNGIGKNNPNAVSILDDIGNIFGCIKDCAQFHNICYQTALNRIKSGKYSTL